MLEQKIKKELMQGNASTAAKRISNLAKKEFERDVRISELVKEKNVSLGLRPEDFVNFSPESLVDYISDGKSMIITHALLGGFSAAFGYWISTLIGG